MGLSPIVCEIIKRIDQLPVGLQQRVLGFVEALAISTPRGIPGTELLQFTKTVAIDSYDADEMQRAIEEACDRVDSDGW